MRRTSLWLACAAICACGAIEESSPAPPAGTPSTPNPPSTPATLPEPTREGNVTVHTTGDTITAGAEFGPKLPAGTPLAEGCTLLVEDGFSKAESQGESDSAGLIDLDIVLGKESNDLQVEFNAERKNYQYLAAGADGHASGTIRVRARGGVVPAFEAEIAAIPPTQLVSPAPGAAIGPRDLKVSWSYEDADRHSIVYLSTLQKDVRCYVPKGRELVIPGALVTELIASQGDLRLFVLTARTQTLDAGDYRISLSHNTSTHVELARE